MIWTGPGLLDHVNMIIGSMWQDYSGWFREGYEDLCRSANEAYPLPQAAGRSQKVEYHWWGSFAHSTRMDYRWQDPWHAVSLYFSLNFHVILQAWSAGVIRWAIILRGLEDLWCSQLVAICSSIYVAQDYCFQLHNIELHDLVYFLETSGSTIPASWGTWFGELESGPFLCSGPVPHATEPSSGARTKKAQKRGPCRVSPVATQRR